MWRFVHLTDPHLGSTVDGQWNNGFLCTMMPDVISCLRRDLATIKPDFLLVTGDIASQQTRDAIYAARDLLDSLGIPYYPMGGNHDYAFPKTREWFVEAFSRRLPNMDTVYSFTHKQIHFCVLDPWWQWKDGTLSPVSEHSIPGMTGSFTKGAQWAIPPHELAWLEEDLEEHKNLPTLLAFHYPVIPIPQRLQRKTLKDAGHLSNGDLLLEILEQYPQVKAILSGHLHMNIIEPQGSIVQIVTSAMPEYPCEYRLITVAENEIEIHTCGLSNSAFAARSLMEGHEYTAGQPQDRQTKIGLK